MFEGSKNPSADRGKHRARPDLAVVTETRAGGPEGAWKLSVGRELFQITFEAAAVGMAHVAPDGRWIRVNRKLCEIVGYRREELLALTFQDITHPDDLEVDLEQVGRMLAGRICSYRIEKRYLRKDWSRVWIDLSLSLVREPLSEPYCFVFVVNDITRRKLEELVPDPLTAQHLEVLRLLIFRRTNPQIAKELTYSVGAVKRHVQGIIAKLRVPDRVRAAERAVEIGLLSPPL
jgi:PAS domain S-box-containing protein